MSVLLQMMRDESYKPDATTEGELEAKRQAAIAWLGARWIYHPAYVYNPKHRIYK
jgi:hypothetical protein